MWPGESQKKYTQITLQWYGQSATPHERVVDLLDREGKSALISSPLRLDESTEVVLVHAGVSEAGFVSSCREEGQNFLINIRLSSPDALSSRAEFQRDPGALVVDNFLTLEDEERILQDLAKELEQSTDIPDQKRSSAEVRVATSLMQLILATWVPCLIPAC